MDDRIGSEYIELFGQLKSGQFVYMRTNYQSMTESVAIFNSFSWVCGGWSCCCQYAADDRGQQ